MKHTCMILSNVIFDRRSMSDSLGGLRGWGQNSTFSEHGHVAYQIKGNHDCSNMAANILPADPHPPPSPLPLGWGKKVKIQLFQNMVMLHIKLKGIMNAATW